MAKGELIFSIDSYREFELVSDFLIDLHRCNTGAILQDEHEESQEIRDLTLPHSYSELGLFKKEMGPLANALDELLRNAMYGLTGTQDIIPHPNFPELILADYLILETAHRARTMYLDSGLRPTEALDKAMLVSYVRAGIVFDSETNQGKIFASHPTIPGYSPQFNIEEARTTTTEAFSRGERNAGGIYSIERGIRHDFLTEAGLTHDLINTKDYPADEKFPDGIQRRKLWMDFQRTRR